MTDLGSIAAARGVSRAVLALGFSLSLAAEALAAGPKLPLTPPEDASTTIADYLKICSTGMVDVDAAAKIAADKGWKTVEPAGGKEKDAASMPAAGAFTATKGDDGTFLVVNRVEFPHVVASSCQMVFATKPADLGTKVLNEIDGVAGGGGVMDMADKGSGLWSFVDDKGEIVTMTAIPAGGTRFVLTMGRAEPTELGRKAGAKPAG
ncbi:hypothetical protein [Jiella sonneratiae]|uniref:Uncharacterized protein n=1 Tax=Jiella sonneratiae TaxID=2816856 RepID=A0ABS3J0R4_9HYPH|nr:hypothetical protein [Jiella sonneratiae]MBO0903256.1 hypothetical protein [Jiella sonneratiae]